MSVELPPTLEWGLGEFFDPTISLFQLDSYDSVSCIFWVSIEPSHRWTYSLLRGRRACPQAAGATACPFFAFHFEGVIILNPLADDWLQWGDDV